MATIPLSSETSTRFPPGGNQMWSTVGTEYSCPSDVRIENGTNGMRESCLRISPIINPKLDQKVPALHYLFAVEPDVEIAADAVDVSFGNPVRAGVFGIGMTKRNVDSGNFFVLQNVSNDVCAGCVGPDREFAYPIAVFIRARVSAKFVAQVLIFRLQRSDTIVFHFDRERIGFQIAKAFTQIIADHTIDHEDTVRVHRRSENFAAGKVTPFIARDNAAGFEPFQLRRQFGFEFRPVWRFARDPLNLSRALDQALAERINSAKVGAHSLEHDFAVNVNHVAMPDFVIVDYAGHLRPGGKLARLRLRCEDRYL